MATAFNDFLQSLKQPWVPNSPMIPSTTANAANAIPFAASPTPLVPPEPPRPASKWPVIALIGALAFGAYYMSGGFGGAGAIAPEKKSSRKRRKAGVKRRKAGGKRRKGKTARGKVTWDW